MVGMGRRAILFTIGFGFAVAPSCSSSSTNEGGGGASSGTGGVGGTGGSSGAAGSEGTDGQVDSCMKGPSCEQCCKDKHPNQQSKFEEAKATCSAQCPDAGDNCAGSGCWSCCVTKQCAIPCYALGACYIKNCL